MSKSCFLFALVCLFLSCQSPEKKSEVNHKIVQTELDEAFVNGYFEKGQDETYVLINKKSIYYFFKEREEFLRYKVMLHMIKKDNTFDNLDFFPNHQRISQLTKTGFGDFDTISIKFESKGFVGIRTGQFKRTENGGSKNIWAKQIQFSEISTNSNNPAKEKFLKTIGMNSLRNHFAMRLHTGSFYRNTFGFYVLLSKNELFMITPKEVAAKNKMMVHLIKENGDFDNLSGLFSNKWYCKCANSEEGELIVYRVVLQDLGSFEKLRLGEFNDYGNKWVQELYLNEVFSNKLLRYNNEFKH
ncbi:MAG: hypothetical protein H2058_08785 [Muricauda sp.]|nr:hypothetical protein [Allomuricauda sp.]MBA4745341.1 hypothetical protein [Allomuricauda sp.]